MNTSLETIDARSRQRILEELDSNFLVEAAAGTGKTTCIVGRMVNLIATGKCAIERLAAVTFTRKAAAELRERFQLELRRESKSTQRNQEQRDRLAFGLQQIELAFVGTIHSFCTMLLRERPIEMNVDPAFRELEESENRELVDLAWTSFLASLHKSNDPLLAQFPDFGLQTSDLKNCFDHFVSHPDVDRWPHDRQSMDDFDVESLKDSLRQYIDHISEFQPDFPADRGSDKLMDRLEAIQRKSQHIHWDRINEVFDLAELFDSSGGCTQKFWAVKSFAKEQKERFQAFRESTIKPAMNWWYGHRYDFSIRVLKQAALVFERLRTESGGLNFEDLLLKSARALQDRPELRDYFQRRFSCLLVDEFQDTDPLQAKIIAFLTSSDHQEKVWSQCDPLPGSLFLVGDPKQSIYRFRRADIVTYGQMKSVFERSAEVLTLSKNFRSTPEICEWNNTVFGNLFPSQETRYAPAANDMLPGRQESAEQGSQGVRWLTIPSDLSESQAKEFEAERIAAHIDAAITNQASIARTQRELDQGISAAAQPGDFLIMTWLKDDLQFYSSALDRRGIPNQVTGSNALASIEELRILTTCLRVIDDVHNPIPYIALLRGAAFGFSDQDLFQYKQAGGRFSYQSLPNDLPEPLQSRFQQANGRLKEYAEWLKRLPFAAAAERIAWDLGLVARSAIQIDGNVTAGGLLKAIELIRAQSWDFDSARDMIGFMESLSQNSEADPLPAMPQGNSVVRVMNLHKVKGLEASVVFVAGAFGRRDFPPRFHIDRSDGSNDGYFAISKKVGYQFRPVAQPSDWEKAAAEETQQTQAEKQRLLYVAATRAKTQLIITRRENNTKSRWNEFDPFLTDKEELQVSELPIQPAIEAAPDRLKTSDVASRWSRLQEPSYRIFAAKTLALRGKARPNWQASGDYGHRWGTVIHELLESRARKPDSDLRRSAALLAGEYEIDHGRVGELVNTVDRVLASDIWNRSLSAKQRYVELPFDLPAGFDDGPAVIRGVIDLLFEESEGWVIVDYKTDDITPDQVSEAADYYRRQLDQYAKAWEGATGMKVVEKGLFFTRINEYHTT
ncbi:MAG: UvrD-helicase domain-containing protein [Rubripirellula sp.]